MLMSMQIGPRGNHGDFRNATNVVLQKLHCKYHCISFPYLKVLYSNSKYINVMG